MITWEGFSSLDVAILEHWLVETVAAHGYTLKRWTFTEMGQEEMRRVNRDFKGRDYDTDVITFQYNKGKAIVGEAMINTAFIAEFANENNVSYAREIARVLIHAMLHCMGYDDLEAEQKEKMRHAEDKALEFLIVSRGTVECVCIK